MSIIILKRVLRTLAELVKGLGTSLVEQSTETLRLEMLEMEHAFLTLVLGSIVGVPVLPVGLAMELLPYVKDEINILAERSARGVDLLADFFSTLGGEW